MAVSLSKVRELTGNDENMVSLVKGAREAAGVSLSKHNLVGLTAEVCMVMDYSGSMESVGQRYSSGEVQAAMERVLALATQFDDDGQVPVILFHNQAWVAGEVNLTNYRGWINQAIRGKQMGGTSYSAAINEVLDYYGLTVGASSGKQRGFFKRSQPAASSGPRQHPIYVAFFTDGEPQDRHQSEEAIRSTCTMPIFWQFVGLGEDFDLLRRLDDLKGREVDNTDFFSANRIADMSDAELFESLLDEFPGWVKEVQKRGWVTSS